jgi:hypothetical protein
VEFRPFLWDQGKLTDLLEGMVLRGKAMKLKLGTRMVALDGSDSSMTAVLAESGYNSGERCWNAI